MMDKVKEMQKVYDNIINGKYERRKMKKGLLLKVNKENNII